MPHLCTHSSPIQGQALLERFTRTGAARTRSCSYLRFLSGTGNAVDGDLLRPNEAPVLFEDSAAVFVPGLFVERDVVTEKVNLSVQTANRLWGKVGNRTTEPNDPAG